MSLITCKECNKEFSSDAKTCPNCGSKKNRSFVNRHPLITILGLLVICPIVVNTFSNNSITPKQSVSSVGQTVVKEIPAVPAKVENWEYDTKEDSMRGTTIKFASTRSTNTVDMDFPYKNSKMDITLREKNKKEEVLISVKGQFSCHSFSESCYINVKFDDNAIEKFEFNQAANSISDTIFIVNTDKFIKQVKSSKHIIIEANLFNSGAQQYQFNVEDLKW
jgi:hypothetical protein